MRRAKREGALAPEQQGFSQDRGVELPSGVAATKLMLPADVLQAVTAASLTARTLHDKLKHHIEQHDANAALAYVTQSGRVDVDAKDSKLLVGMVPGPPSIRVILHCRRPGHLATGHVEQLLEARAPSWHAVLARGVLRGR